jgi:hypothetical protein
MIMNELVFALFKKPSSSLRTFSVASSSSTFGLASIDGVFV